MRAEKLGKCKSAGPDQIPRETLKSGCEVLILIFGIMKLPQKEEESTVIPVCKKRVKTDCSTGRSHAHKFIQ